MARRDRQQLDERVLGIGVAVALMVAGVLVIGPWLFPPPPHLLEAPDQDLVPAAKPIPAEADVFRTQVGQFGADPDPALRLRSHRRTLAVPPRLRAYPGAPPRIPHGLTLDEFKRGSCNTCHQRGGYVERFATYAPLTPHPEMGQCLQCHVADDRLVGVPAVLPEGTPVCAQCHILSAITAPPPRLVAIDWPEPRWITLGHTASPGGPPLIPHRLQTRGNCVACHGGMGAVFEIRTTHPERANCRQCHVVEADDGAPFTRTAVLRGGAGGAP